MRMMYLAVLGIFAAMPAFAQDPLTPQQREENDRRFNDALAQFAIAAEQEVMEIKTHCVNAVGNLQFCTCLSLALPKPMGMVMSGRQAVSFAEYIAATSHTNEELRYPLLSPNDRNAIDDARAARVKCVGPLAGSWK